MINILVTVLILLLLLAVSSFRLKHWTHESQNKTDMLSGTWRTKEL